MEGNYHRLILEQNKSTKPTFLDEFSESEYSDPNANRNDVSYVIKKTVSKQIKEILNAEIDKGFQNKIRKIIKDEFEIKIKYMIKM